MDPLCGWCYGNSTNTQQLYDKYGELLNFEILPAGMWVGSNVRLQSKPMAEFIKKHDPHIQQTTGTEFGKDYFKFIENPEIVLDSEIPSRAVVTGKQLWKVQAIPFAIEVQKARYWHGKDLNLDETYLTICTELGLNKEEFLNSFHSDEIKKATQKTFEVARQFARSYPTLLMEKEGKKYVLEQGYSSFENIVNQIEELIY